MNKKDFLVEFIDLYQSYPCLWKVKSPDYSNKIIKNEAYGALVCKYRQVDYTATRDSVVKRIASIRAAFRKEFRKLENSKKSGAGTEDIHKLTLWYFNNLMFLKDQDIARTGASTLDETLEASEEINVCNNSELITISCEETTNSSMNSSAESTPWPTPSPSASTPVPTERPSKRPKNKQAVVFDLIAERLQAKKDMNINRYDLQAKTWAQELKEMPTDTATEAIRLFNEVMYQAKKRNINEHTRVQQQTYVPLSSYQGEVPTQNTYLKQMKTNRLETSTTEPTYSSLTNFQVETVPQDNLETYFANFTGGTY